MTLAVSIATAAAISQRSRRTWWRRMAEGVVARTADSRGRAMLNVFDVLRFSDVVLSPEEIECLVLADSGDADAQNDIGQIFSADGHFHIAAYWFEQAALRGNADAMQLLGRCYVAGEGVPRNKHLGLMWIARAAASGHLIARAQVHQTTEEFPAFVLNSEIA